jgi:CRISPR system Cascade subunit CasE
MMLSRLLLDPRSRDVQRALGDSQIMHARVMSMFPDGVGTAPRAALGVLHRLEHSERANLLTLLVQSNERPEPGRLPHGFLDAQPESDAFATRDLKPLLEAIEGGAKFRFRLRANATRRIDTKSAPDGTRRNGRRVPVRGEDGREAWIRSRLQVHGMRLAGPSEQKPEGRSIGHAQQRVRTHEGCVFDGILEIVDAERARRAVAQGIGPAKAYGFGLLSLARP